MADMTNKSSLEQLLRPLRRELNAELAALLLRMQAEDEVKPVTRSWRSGIPKGS
jgi:hypothetical protein